MYEIIKSPMIIKPVLDQVLTTRPGGPGGPGGPGTPGPPLGPGGPCNNTFNINYISTKEKKSPL